MNDATLASESERAALARRIIDENRYMTLATADGAGRPWASPVWYAHSDYREFIWVSRPDTRHSLNISARPEVGIVIFDSTVVPGRGQAVYIDGAAREVPTAHLTEALAVYSRKSEQTGLPPWSLKDVHAGRYRLFVANAVEQFVLDGNDRRIAAEPAKDGGRGSPAHRAGGPAAR